MHHTHTHAHAHTHTRTHAHTHTHIHIHTHTHTHIHTQLVYNDISPMENHHLAATFQLLAQDRYNFLERAPKEVSACVPERACVHFWTAHL